MDDLIRSVVTATDLSEASLRAVERAMGIAVLSGSHCTVVHALGLDALGPLREVIGALAESATEKITARQRAVLDPLVAESARHHGIRAELRVVPGLATNEVPAQIRAAGANLAVIGARGRGVLRHMFVGSTASRLLRKSDCPVLVVRGGGREPYRRVLIAVDFSPASASSVRYARAMAPAAEILLLHVLDVPFEGMLHYAGVSGDVVDHYRREAREAAVTGMREMARAAGLPDGGWTLLVERGDATTTILEVQADRGCDLVVMGKHGTHVTEELLIGSVTKRVLAESPSDMLVLVDHRIPGSDQVK
jgi:nucleotide-binding universal stress UspA family protein